MNKIAWCANLAANNCGSLELGSATNTTTNNRPQQAFAKARLSSPNTFQDAAAPASCGRRRRSLPRACGPGSWYGRCPQILPYLSSLIYPPLSTTFVHFVSPGDGGMLYAKPSLHLKATLFRVCTSRGVESMKCSGDGLGTVSDFGTYRSVSVLSAVTAFGVCFLMFRGFFASSFGEGTEG
jgi:hypothetical protein